MSLHETILATTKDSEAKKEGYGSWPMSVEIGSRKDIHKIMHRSAIAAMEEIAKFERFKRIQKWIFDDEVDGERRYFSKANVLIEISETELYQLYKEKNP